MSPSVLSTLISTSHSLCGPRRHSAVKCRAVLYKQQAELYANSCRTSTSRCQRLSSGQFTRTSNMT